MNIVLLKAKDIKTSVVNQQKHIFRYANQNMLNIDSTEIDNSSLNEKLESKNELKGFLRSLSYNDNVLIYSLATFSSGVEELIKILNCLFERSISIYVTNINLKIAKDIKAGEIFSLLLNERDNSMETKRVVTQGRPKGRMSKSKFDIHRLEIIEYLEKKYSVLKISKLLGVSRSSLKDYINSRGLKELVEARKKLLRENDFERKLDIAKPECKIIKKDRRDQWHAM